MDVGYSAMVSLEYEFDDERVSNQDDIADNILGHPDSDSSIYNCPYDQDQLTLFACAFFMPAVHTSPNGNLEVYKPCRSFCEGKI